MGGTRNLQVKDLILLASLFDFSINPISPSAQSEWRCF